MLIRNHGLNESHFLSSFISFLKDEIKMTVKLFKPQTLKVAIEKARMQKRALESVEKKGKVGSRSLVISGGEADHRPNSTVLVATVGTSKPPTTYRVSRAVYEYNKANHLCYKYGEKYSPGHQSKYQQLNCIIRDT